MEKNEKTVYVLEYLLETRALGPHNMTIIGVELFETLDFALLKASLAYKDYLKRGYEEIVMCEGDEPCKYYKMGEYRMHGYRIKKEKIQVRHTPIPH